MLDRELTGVTDWKLMCFERMRVLDMAHCWSADTHSKYQGKLCAFAQFESEYDLRVLRPTPLLCPPDGAGIGLMWMMESYSLRQSRFSSTDEVGPLSNATVRQLRSAMSQYIAWDTMVSQPSAYFDKEKRLIIIKLGVPLIAWGALLLLLALPLELVITLLLRLLSSTAMCVFSWQTWRINICPQ
jgi:hypothetical protein